MQSTSLTGCGTTAVLSTSFIINKLTGGHYINNSQQWIETSQGDVHIDLCVDKDNRTQYLMVSSNCNEIQPLAAAQQASHNPATFGYDPWPAEFLTVQVKTVANFKHDLSQSLNCDGHIDELLQSLNYMEQTIPDGVPLEFESLLAAATRSTFIVALRKLNSTKSV